MAQALVLMAPCRECKNEQFRHLDDDGCFERFLEAGNPPQNYDAVQQCEHYTCNVCGRPA